MSPREAKKDPRLKSSGMLKCFFFDGKEIPISPKTIFYDWIYINALLENPSLANEVIGYDAFTDIEFNPEKIKIAVTNANNNIDELSKRLSEEQINNLSEFLIEPLKGEILSNE